MDRRTFLKAAAGSAARRTWRCTGAVQAPAVHAQAAWPAPGRTVKVIVPWPPGAANDALGRLLAQKLQEKFGATAVVENRTGGAGLVGTNAVIQAEPDGYTLLASAFNTAVMPMVIKGAKFDPEVDLEVVARTAVAPLVCVMTGARPQKDLAEMLAAAKAKPQDWTVRDLFARLGRASGDHRVHPPHRRQVRPGALSRHHAGADRHHGRQCPAAVRSRLRAAAGREGPDAGARARHRDRRRARSSRPSLPTIGRAGLPGFEFNSWYGVWAPKGTPREISQKVNGADPGDDARSRDRVAADHAAARAGGREHRRTRRNSSPARSSARASCCKLVNFQPA